MKQTNFLTFSSLLSPALSVCAGWRVAYLGYRGAVERNATSINRSKVALKGEA